MDTDFIEYPFQCIEYTSSEHSCYTNTFTDWISTPNFESTPYPSSAVRVSLDAEMKEPFAENPEPSKIIFKVWSRPENSFSCFYHLLSWFRLLNLCLHGSLSFSTEPCGTWNESDFYLWFDDLRFSRPNLTFAGHWVLNIKNQTINHTQATPFTTSSCTVGALPCFAMADQV